MKKIKTTIILMCTFLMALNLQAQEIRALQHIQDGNLIHTILLSEIDSITFTNYNIPNNSSGVEIDGVVWALYNVNDPGAFASKPEDAGMLYQWNRPVGWSSSNPLENNTGGTVWNSSIPTGDTWTPENNVCPTGWRLPTQSELQSLLNSGSFWGALNGVDGRFFGSGEERVFFPATGYRAHRDGTLSYAGSEGDYWSSTDIGAENAYTLSFDSNYVGMNYNFRSFGFSVRCVAE